MTCIAYSCMLAVLAWRTLVPSHDLQRRVLSTMTVLLSCSCCVCTVLCMHVYALCCVLHAGECASVHRRMQCAVQLGVHAVLCMQVSSAPQRVAQHGGTWTAIRRAHAVLCCGCTCVLHPARSSALGSQYRPLHDARRQRARTDTHVACCAFGAASCYACQCVTQQ